MEHLPEDILFEIFSWVYYYGPILALTCRRFNEICKSGRFTDKKIGIFLHRNKKENFYKRLEDFIVLNDEDENKNNKINIFKFSKLKICYEAIRFGRFDLLKWALKNGFFLSKNYAIKFAIKNCQYNIVRFLRENEYIYDDDDIDKNCYLNECCENITLFYHENMTTSDVDYLVSEGYIDVENLMKLFLVKGRPELTNHLYKLQSSRRFSLKNLIYYLNTYEIIVEFHEKSIPWILEKCDFECKKLTSKHCDVSSAEIKNSFILRNIFNFSNPADVMSLMNEHFDFSVRLDRGKYTREFCKFIKKKEKGFFDSIKLDHTTIFTEHKLEVRNIIPSVFSIENSINSIDLICKILNNFPCRPISDDDFINECKLYSVYVLIDKAADLKNKSFNIDPDFIKNNLQMIMSNLTTIGDSESIEYFSSKYNIKTSDFIGEKIRIEYLRNHVLLKKNIELNAKTTPQAARYILKEIIKKNEEYKNNNISLYDIFELVLNQKYENEKDRIEFYSILKEILKHGKFNYLKIILKKYSLDDLLKWIEEDTISADFTSKPGKIMSNNNEDINPYELKDIFAMLKAAD
jgi:hypothetical protein